MGIVLTRSAKRQLRTWNMADDKGAERYLIAVIIIFVSLIAIYVFYNYGHIFSRYQIISSYEIIRIKSTCVTKSTHAYFVTINFANYGATNTSIDSVLLNGIPYNDSGWTGTIKPMIFGDITPNTWINTSIRYDPDPPLRYGIIIFSDDCRDPSGKELIVDGENSHHLNIAIRTTSGASGAFVALSWNCYLETPLCPASTLAIAMVEVMALVALIIMVRRRATTNKIKGSVVSV